ncbi:MAG: NAD(P)H-dependent glycerol-3-phosphate dehydrogenase [Syntrophomonadaceae bacterium]|nr:NAD(P)H-dependent glycerol-3-phosphate dehydrogenase [Syntrophomonadaceae bacterium]
MSKACVLGAGSWGTALSVVLAHNMDQVVLWGRPEDGIRDIRHQRENKRYLPGVKLGNNIFPSQELAAAVNGCKLLVLSVPAQAQRQVLEQVRPYWRRSMYVVNTAKGLEMGTHMRLSQVCREVLGEASMERYAVLSGPSHAEEVGRALPTAVTVAAQLQDTACYVQDCFMTDALRVYTNADTAGVELGGALKNVIALAAGMAYGLGYGDNTVAALMTRGLAEITRLGEHMGGAAATFAGLSGMGDLIVTCGSRHSRNRRAGELLGSGLSLKDTQAQIGMVVEGVTTVQAVYELAQQSNVEMPITSACYRIIWQGAAPGEELMRLMTRQRRHETEEEFRGSALQSPDDNCRDT